MLRSCLEDRCSLCLFIFVVGNRWRKLIVQVLYRLKEEWLFEVISVFILLCKVLGTYKV